MNRQKLKGQTALITGAGKRIGHCIAVALARKGVNIVIHYPDAVKETDELRKELTKIGVKFWLIQANFEKPEEYGSLIQRTIAAAGSLNILINNASIFTPDTLKDMSLDDLIRHIRVNSWAPFVLSRDFAVAAGKGKIVNILDTKILSYDRAHVTYILSKQLLAILTRITALEYAPGITVNGVCPGLILPPPGKDQAYLETLAGALPLKKHGSPEDIADAVLYFLTADFVTGQIIYADGGRHLLENEYGPHPY